MIRRFLTRILIAFGFHHDENCPGRLVMVETQFGHALKCDRCGYSSLIDRNAGEG